MIHHYIYDSPDLLSGLFCSAMILFEISDNVFINWLSKFNKYYIDILLMPLLQLIKA